MNKNQLVNIKKMIFELGRGGSKNHFFDRVNDVGEVERFFAFAQNDAGSKLRGAGERSFCAPHIFKATSGHQLSTGLRGFFSKNKDSEKKKIPAYKFIREFYFIDAVRRYSGKSAQTQTGRSMLEMLGVLAIIGVLSVGAVMGFRQAMNRHKANVILNDVSLAFEELATHETTGAVSRYQVTAFTPESGHTLYAKRDENGNDSVEVAGVAQGVCEVLIQYDKTELYTQISDTAGAKLTACADNQTMVFGLGAGSSGSTDPDPGPGPEPTDPCEGKTCSGHGTCSDGVCTCSDGYTDPDCGTAPECNSTIACASPKVCSTDYHCECPSIGTPGVCQTTGTQNGCPAIVNVTGKCGSNGICTNGACSECSSPMVANADGTACECPAKGANCKTQNSLTCECDVCEDGFQKNAAGECVEANPCGEGQVAVTNYDSAGNDIGTACCETKADYENNYSGNNYESKSNYKVVGAINASCCAGYSDEKEWYVSGGERHYVQISTFNYKIRVNGNIAYCALSGINGTINARLEYESDSKFCNYDTDTGDVNICFCAPSGDPASSSEKYPCS